MGRPRLIDYDEAKGLRADGCTLAEIAAVYGVSQQAVRLAVDDDVRAASIARVAEWQRQGTCPDCGAPATRHHANASHRCRACANVLQITSVRPDALLCFTCKKWKRDDDFPFNRHKRAKARRGRHNACRECQTILRREYRERNKVPCSTCGTLVLHERRDPHKPPECRSCANARTVRAGLTGRRAKTTQAMSA